MQYTKSEASKKNIIDAALLLVRRQGFAKTSIRAICKAAGVSTGAFYHYFKTKDELLGEAFLHVDETLAKSVAEYDALPPLDALKKVLVDQTSLTAGEGYPIITDYYRVLLAATERPALSRDREYYRAVLKYTQMAQACGRLRSSAPAADIADSLIKYVRGCLIDWCLRNGSYDVAASVAGELDSIFDISQG